MRRIAILPAVVLLVATVASSAFGADNDTVEAIRARVQKALDVVAAKTNPRVLVIPIREGIEASTAVFVEREMKRAKDEKFDLVLAELHTPGGYSDAMMRICNAFLQKDAPAGKHIPVVAFVDTDAYSAGAIICLSCDRIYIAPGGKMGAATGWFPGPDGLPVKLPEDVQEKFLSAQRAEVRSLAKVDGYAPGVAEAMVDRNVVLTEYEIDGRHEFLTEKEFENRRQELGLADLSPVEYAKRVKILRTICAKGELLTLDYQEAKEVGLATAIVGSREALFETLGVKAAIVTVSEHNWSEFVFGFLSSPAVRGILLLLGLAGLYVEFKTPGFGLPGVGGVICLALFFFSQYFMGLASYTGVLIFLLGLVLVLVEIFLLPGFGVPGIVGIILMVVGLLLGMQPWVIPDVHNPFDVHIFFINVTVIGIVLIAMSAFAVIVAKYLPSMPLLGRIILTSTGPAGELRSSATVEEAEKSLVGTKGTALSRLRPSGRAGFGEQILDVVTEGEFLEAGTAIEVMKVEGNRVVVRKSE